MFFVLSKVLTGLMMPLSLIVAFLLLAIISRNKRTKYRCIRASLFLLLLFTNDYVADIVIGSWEQPYVSSLSLKDTYDVGVVLTGIAKPSRTPYDRPEFNHGADRLLHAVRLYKNGKIKKLLITGGKASIGTQNLMPESEVLKDAAISFGVKANDIVIENKANNTYENAKFTKTILEQQFGSTIKVLLITSAFHMKRAKACFIKQGIECDTFPTDFYSSTTTTNPFNNIYPSSGAITKWNIVIKEWMGYTIYYLKGYL